MIKTNDAAKVAVVAVIVVIIDIISIIIILLWCHNEETLKQCFLTFLADVGKCNWSPVRATARVLIELRGLVPREVRMVIKRPAEIQINILNMIARFQRGRSGNDHGDWIFISFFAEIDF